ncbi:hypothetical protein LL963_20285 [Xanthomonas campestris pv. esculenti]|nr:hypothetical protein [Xanthomonas campestris pv. esculenti]
MAVAAMALFRNLLQSNWSAMLRLTQSSLRKVNLEPLFLGATEAQAQAFMDRDELPNTRVMVAAIEAEEPFKCFPIFTRQFQNGIEHLHSFTHGGNKIAIPYLAMNEIAASYQDDDVINALESIEAIALTICVGHDHGCW